MYNYFVSAVLYKANSGVTVRHLFITADSKDEACSELTSELEPDEKLVGIIAVEITDREMQAASSFEEEKQVTVSVISNGEVTTVPVTNKPGDTLN